MWDIFNQVDKEIMEADSSCKDTDSDEDEHETASLAEEELYEEDDEQVVIEDPIDRIEPHRKKAIVENYIGDKLIREEEISDSEEELEMEDGLLGSDSDPDP
jgi:hypothetical protein